MFSWLSNKIKTFFRITAEYQQTDPVQYCEFHRDNNCVHVDGYLCNADTCNTRTDYQLELLARQKHQKPVSRKK